MKTSPKCSYSVTENERFGLVFAKTGSINSGTGVFSFRENLIKNPQEFVCLANLFAAPEQTFDVAKPSIKNFVANLANLLAFRES